MDVFIISAQTARHIFIHFHDGNFAVYGQTAVMGITQTEVETALVIHRSYLGTPDLWQQMGKLPGRVIGQQIGFMVIEGIMGRQTKITGFTIQRSKIPGKVLEGLLFPILKNNVRHRQNRASAPDRYILQPIAGPFGQSYVKIDGLGGKHPIVYDHI